MDRGEAPSRYRFAPAAWVRPFSPLRPVNTTGFGGRDLLVISRHSAAIAGL
jgi:hypothetical protein